MTGCIEVLAPNHNHIYEINTVTMIAQSYKVTAKTDVEVAIISFRCDIHTIEFRSARGDSKNDKDKHNFQINTIVS